MKVENIEFKRGFALVTFEDHIVLFADPAYLKSNGLTAGDSVPLNAFREANKEFARSYAMQAAVRSLARSARTERQIKDLLYKKHIQRDVISEVIETLKSYRYIDDEKFAEFFTNDAKAAHKGTRLIRQKLNESGINRETTDDVLAAYSEEEQAENTDFFLEKQNRLLMQLPHVLRREKLYARAIRRGFEPAQIADSIDKLFECEDSDYSEFYQKAIGKKIGAYQARRLSIPKIREKLYAEFLPKGAKPELIDLCISESSEEADADPG